MATLNLQCAESADDAKERAGLYDPGAMILDDTAPYFAYYDANYIQHVGLRFAGVSGLSGQTITAAVLTFRAFGDNSGDFVGDWYGHDVAAPGVFTTTAYNISSIVQRPRTTATCEGDGSDFGAWTNGADQTFTGNGVNYIKDIVQELAAANPSAIALLWIYTSGTGQRKFLAWDYGSATAPKLDITYSPPPVYISGTVAAVLNTTEALRATFLASGAPAAILSAASHPSRLIPLSGAPAAVLSAISYPTRLVLLSGASDAVLDALATLRASLLLSGASNAVLDALATLQASLLLSGASAAVLDATASAIRRISTSGVSDAELAALLALIGTFDASGTLAAELYARNHLAEAGEDLTHGIMKGW